MKMCWIFLFSDLFIDRGFEVGEYVQSPQEANSMHVFPSRPPLHWLS
jgi:hypothetical protein